MATELPKQYDPRQAQQRWLQFWQERGYFHSRPDPDREPICIVIPPPNVTGALHMGHARTYALQDVLIRWRRMQGYNALWMPGTDHAGIGTQAVVERRLWGRKNAAVVEGKEPRRDLSVSIAQGLLSASNNGEMVTALGPSKEEKERLDSINF